MKLLLVENSHDFSTWLTKHLDQSGFSVEHASTREQASRLLDARGYDLVLLDLSLPNSEARILIESLRQNDNNVPVLIIGTQENKRDIIECLNLGADGCQKKPFDYRELEARLRALLRRSSVRASPVLSRGSLHYNTMSKQFCSGEDLLALTPREHDLLELLIRSDGIPISTNIIANSVNALEYSVSIKAMHILMVRLRKKVEKTGVRIVTMRGIGYKLAYPT